MEKKFLQEQFEKAERAEVPKKMFYTPLLKKEILSIQGYLKSLINERPPDDYLIKKINEIGYSADTPFDGWLKKRNNHYKEQERMVFGIHRKQDKEGTEKKCMEVFLQNKGEDLSDWEINKFPDDRTIDVEAKNRHANKIIRAQIRVLDDEMVGDLMARGWHFGGNTLESDKELIRKAIRAKEKKYSVEDTQNIYLLLFDTGHIMYDTRTDIIQKNLINENFQNFQEIYIVDSWSKKNVKIKGKTSQL